MTSCCLCGVLVGRDSHSGRLLAVKEERPACGYHCGRVLRAMPIWCPSYSAWKIQNNGALICRLGNCHWLVLIFLASNLSSEPSQGCCAFSLRPLYLIFPFVLQTLTLPHPVSFPERPRIMHGKPWIIWRNLTCLDGVKPLRILGDSPSYLSRRLSQVNLNVLIF